MSVSGMLIKITIEVALLIFILLLFMSINICVYSHSAKETLAMMRAYVQLVSSHWSPHWRMFRRWIIFKFYAEYLVKTCQNKTFVTSANNRCVNILYSSIHIHLYIL
jgi:hypothetical protein